MTYFQQVNECYSITHYQSVKHNLNSATFLPTLYMIEDSKSGIKQIYSSATEIDRDF